MKTLGLALLAGVLLVAAAITAASSAATPAAPAPMALQSTLDPGNYCLGCHVSGEVDAGAVFAWDGGIAREASRPCPALARLHEEVYYTERLLLAVSRAQAQRPWLATGDSAAIDARLDAARESYARLLDAPVTSLDAFTAQAQAVRYQLGKVYSAAGQQVDGARRRAVLAAAGLVSLALLGSLAWGWRNTGRHLPEGARRLRRPSPKAVTFVALVFLAFALPVFRQPAAAVEVPSADKQAALSALDIAKRQATAAERATDRAWMLARVAAAWSRLDPAKAESLLAEALAAERAARDEAEALWGAAQAAHEAAVGSAPALEDAVLAAQELRAVRGRATGLRLIAAEWIAADPDRARNLLDQALDVASQEQDSVYRDIDLRAIAATWAPLDVGKAQQVAGQVSEPLMRAWAYRAVAVASGTAAPYAQALDAARQIADGGQRARVLADLAAATGDEALIGEALSALGSPDGAAYAYGLSDIVATGRAPNLATRIGPAYPEALAAALLRLGQYREAWQATAGIADALERDRARAAIAAAWVNPEVVQEIAEPALHDWALREITLKTGRPSLTEAMRLPYYRVSALAGLGQFQTAWDAAQGLAEPYPLIGLASDWATEDVAAALAVIDALSREADKAEALRAITVASPDPDLFERALGLALAARVRGDSLAPAEASLALARVFLATDPRRAEAALEQAYTVARAIAVK